jgi:hypothetical protein
MSVIQQRAECTRSYMERRHAGASTFCRLPDGGHSVTRLPLNDSPDSMSVIQQRAECSRSYKPLKPARREIGRSMIVKNLCKSGDAPMLRPPSAIAYELFPDFDPPRRLA